MSFTIRVYIIESKNKQRILTLVCKKNDSKLAQRYVLRRTGTVVCDLGFIRPVALLAVLSCRQYVEIEAKKLFLKRDKERYIETLYASQDGYLAFIYPDEKINDPRKKSLSAAPGGWPSC